jgi:cyclase
VDARGRLAAGAAPGAANTAALARPERLGELSRRFGSQATVLSVAALRRPGGGWEGFAAGGRRPTGREALGCIAAGVERGAGELLLTSNDADAPRAGYDLALNAAVPAAVGVPFNASGGAGSPDHLAAALDAGAAAVLAASIFHTGAHTVAGVKRALAAAGHPVREAAA